MSNKNTKKTIAMATAAIAVTTGAMAVSGKVHADTINPSANNNTETTNTQASDLKSQQDASRQNYADANKANKQAQSDLAQATAKNTEAQEAVNNAQSDVNKASGNVQSATNAEQNAQTAVDHAQSEANNAQADYNNAVSQAAQTDQAAKQAQADLNKANQAVSDAQKTADAASQKQAQAQSNADTAAQNVDAANAQVQKSQGDVDKAQGDVKTAQNNVSNAQNHEQVIAQDTQDVTAKTNAKNAADAKVNDAQKTSEEKNAAKNKAEGDVETAQKTVDELRKTDTSAPVKESINVNQDYINLMKKVQERLMSPSNTTAMDFNAEEGQEYGKLAQLLQPQQHYINDPNLAKIPVKINSDGTLSKADQIDATQFYFSLINPIRKAIGMPELKISEDALQMTTNIAKQYNADDWCIYPQKVINQNGFDIVSYDTSNPHFGQHDTNAIDKNGAANENAIAVPNNTSTIYNTPDDPTSGIKDFHYNTTTWATNRDELHQAMFENAVGGLLEYGNTPGHAENLLGLHIPALNTGNGFAAIQTDKFGQVHFNVESSSINDTSTEIPVKISSTDNHESQLASAKQALQDAQAKLTTATTEASQADATLASAQAEAQKAAEELKTAQDKLAHDQASSMSLEQAQAELQKAQNTLAQKQANLADAKTAAQKAQAMQSQADSALASAEATSQKAQAALIDAQAKAQAAQARVDEFTGANKAVAAAQDKLNAANEALQVAKSNHDTARENLTKAQDALKTAESKLKAAQDAATQASQALADAQTKADKAKTALDKAKAELITDAKVYGDSVDIKDVTIHVGEAVPAPQITNPMAADPTQSLVMGAYLKMAASKLDTIPTGTTAAWSELNQLNADAQIVGSHQEEALVTFPDGSTMTLNVPLTVLAAETPVTPVNPSDPAKPGDHTGDHSHTTVPTDPTDHTKPAQPTNNTGTHTSGDTTNTTTSTDPTNPSDQQGDHEQSSTGDRNVTVTPSHDATVNSEVNGDNNVTAKPIATNANTVTTPAAKITRPGDHTGDHSHTTVPTDPTDHNQGQTDGQHTSGDTTHTTTPTDLTNPSDQQGDHEQSSTGDRNVTVTPSHDATVNSEVNGDNNVTAKPIATNANTVTTPAAKITSGQQIDKRSDLNNGRLPQTSNKNETGLVGLGLLTIASIFGFAVTRRKN